MSPIRAALGERFAALPEVVRRAHAGEGETRLDGATDIVRTGRAPGSLAAALFGYPPSGAALRTRIVFTPTSGGETWTRSFGPRRLVTHMRPGGPGRVAERFGAVTFVMALEPVPDGFALRVVGWRFLGLPLPGSLRPRVDARIIGEVDGTYRFDIAIRMPLLGELVRYAGRLRPH